MPKRMLLWLQQLKRQDFSLGPRWHRRSRGPARNRSSELQDLTVCGGGEAASVDMYAASGWNASAAEARQLPYGLPGGVEKGCQPPADAGLAQRAGNRWAYRGALHV
jgi:hypothetical protein